MISPGDQENAADDPEDKPCLLCSGAANLPDPQPADNSKSGTGIFQRRYRSCIQKIDFNTLFTGMFRCCLWQRNGGFAYGVSSNVCIIVFSGLSLKNNRMP